MSYKDFNKMLDSLYESIDESKTSKFYIPEPKFTKKPTRMDWNNVNEFLKIINRHPIHFVSFIKNERKIMANYNGSILMLQGKFRKDDITKIMTEYLDKYCKCPVCGSYHTKLVKDVTVRKEKINCDKCKSITYVN